MRTFRIREEPGRTRLTRHPDYKAILLIALVDLTLFLAYHLIPFGIRWGLLVAFTSAAAGVLWPRIVGEEVDMTSLSFKYRRGLWPFIVSTEIEWQYMDPPRILNPGIRTWRGPIGFNDSRTGQPYRIAPGLPPEECRRFLAAIEQFHAATL